MAGTISRETIKKITKLSEDLEKASTTEQKVNIAVALEEEIKKLAQN